MSYLPVDAGVIKVIPGDHFCHISRCKIMIYVRFGNGANLNQFLPSDKELIDEKFPDSGEFMQRCLRGLRYSNRTITSDKPLV